ncbi:aminopeptidase N [Brevibacterium sanguinis]|uniref:Aminopeptidase N n=2 Tax=Brevibacterium TaxID=1696 RepID=A0A366IN54_9MICO|nr:MULTISPECIES: aminopeptidase N [Brevibacterium]RBP66468.1 aminopeptidase N [Brevibacterium sanguinis]RBP73120.1 aminopeptidase N [Brevibacterium celere]
MPHHNLTREEAQTRASLVDVSSYEIVLVLDGRGEHFRVRSRTRFTAAEGSTSFIDAITASVERIQLNGLDLEIAEVVSPARITLPGLAAENELVIDAHFHYMNTGEGLHRFVDPIDDETYLYTQFEVPDARRVFPVFEQPDLKASFSFTVVAPDHWTVVSNSPTPTPADPSEVFADLGEKPIPDTSVWQFAPTTPISSYITAIVAGPYRSVHSELVSSDGSPVPLGLYCRASLFEHLDAENLFAITRAGFEFFEREFGTAYPFEKYDQLFVPEFNAGAMENAGAVTILENYIFRSRPTEALVERRAVTVLHELAHMWFGDLVTMRWWNDLWLNESFAEFMSTLATAEATRFAEAWTTFATIEKSWAYRQDQLPSTHPIVAPIEDLADVEVNFDGITYAKGASVLKQLVAWVGRAEFFAGLTTYFHRHAWSNTELADLLDELEATSGRDLGTWSRLWLEESGINLITAEVDTESTDAGEVVSALRVTQEPWILEDQPVPSLRPHRLAIGFYSDDGSGRLVRTHSFPLDIDSAEATVAEARGVAKPDVIVVNDADLTYAKVRFDPESMRVAGERLGDFEDSLTQLLILNTLWDGVRDGDRPVQEYIDVVLTHLAAITHSSGLLMQMRQLDTAVGAYLPPADRARAHADVADRLLDLLGTIASGTDQAFQFVQGFVRHARTEEQISRLQSWLDLEEGEVFGIALDTDLRWQILIALAGRDACTEEAITSAVEADPSATGQRQAATARSARPTTEAKTWAFTRMIDDIDLPNSELGALAIGFARGLQLPDGELIAAGQPLHDFASEYFQRVSGWWETRTLEMAQTMTQRLFPPASERTVDQARQWLADHPAAPKGLVRLMRENLADAQRALRAQEVSRHSERALTFSR